MVMVHATRYILYDLLGTCGCASWMTTEELVCGVVVDMDGAAKAAAADTISRKGENYSAHKPNRDLAANEPSTGVSRSHEPDTS